MCREAIVTVKRANLTLVQTRLKQYRMAVICMVCIIPVLSAVAISEGASFGRGVGGWVLSRWPLLQTAAVRIKRKDRTRFYTGDIKTGVDTSTFPIPKTNTVLNSLMSFASLG